MPPPGYQLYFIAILPPSPVREEALALKKYFAEKYKSKASLNSPPHITLHMPFQWKEKKEDELIAALRAFTANQKSFSVQLNGFNGFEPRVVFIHVLQNESLSMFQQQLMQWCKVKLKLFHPHYQDLPYHPHITLAFRDLRKLLYFQAMEEFQHQPFTHTFMADRIALLKHDGKHWNVLTEFSLAS